MAPIFKTKRCGGPQESSMPPNVNYAKICYGFLWQMAKFWKPVMKYVSNFANNYAVGGRGSPPFINVTAIYIYREYTRY